MKSIRLRDDPSVAPRHAQDARFLDHDEETSMHSSAAPTSILSALADAAPGITSMSTGRLGATVAAVIGLAGVVVGVLTLVRPGGWLGAGRRGVSASLAAGLIATALGGLVVATSDSGIGTGNGRGGAIVATVLGLIAVALGGLALARSRHAG
jgi:hypothetical protein